MLQNEENKDILKTAFDSVDSMHLYFKVFEFGSFQCYKLWFLCRTNQVVLIPFRVLLEKYLQHEINK